MSSLGKLGVVLVALVLVGLLLFCTTSSEDSPPSFGKLEGFDRYRDRITQWRDSEYQVLGVVDEGLMIRVNLMDSRRREEQSPAIRVRTLNALYRIQSLIGTDVSASVWLYRSRDARDTDLLGMGFYHALTETTVFKRPEEIQ
jgi:hypothetical protein